jgi:hypothetical protein
MKSRMHYDLASDVSRFLNYHPTFKVRKSKDFLTLEGTYKLKLEDGVELASFELKIEMRGWPKLFPKVTETRGKIKPAAQNHINGDRSFCLVARILNSIHVKR